MIKTPPPKVPIAVTFLLAASLASAQQSIARLSYR
jgi:hypothetical protein